MIVCGSPGKIYLHSEQAWVVEEYVLSYSAELLEGEGGGGRESVRMFSLQWCSQPRVAHLQISGPVTSNPGDHGGSAEAPVCSGGDWMHNKLCAYMYCVLFKRKSALLWSVPSGCHQELHFLFLSSGGMCNQVHPTMQPANCVTLERTFDFSQL